MDPRDASGLPGVVELWDQTTGDPAICIAILDGPADVGHPCFAASLLEVAQLVSEPSAVAPKSSHGTHVASVLFAQHTSALKGLVPACRGLAIPIYSENDRGDLAVCNQTDLVRAISLAVQHGAKIINISGGEYSETGQAQHLLADAIRKCADQGILVVAAAGNDGCKCLHVPAALPTVLAVGAADDDGRPLDSSNWDEILADHGILAPGYRIRGAAPNNGIAELTGTSFATPIVSGIAALLMSAQIKRGFRPDAHAVRAALIRSAIPCSAQQDDESDCRRMLAGRVNIPGAYAELFGEELARKGIAGRNANGPGYRAIAQSIPVRPSSVMISAQEAKPDPSLQPKGVTAAMSTSNEYGQHPVMNVTSPSAHQPYGQPVQPNGAQLAAHSAMPLQMPASAAQVAPSGYAQPQATYAQPAIEPSMAGQACQCGGGMHPAAAQPQQWSHPIGDMPALPLRGPAMPMIYAPSPPQAPTPQQQAHPAGGPSGYGARASAAPQVYISGRSDIGHSSRGHGNVRPAFVPPGVESVPAGVAVGQTGGPGTGNLPLAAQFITSRNSELVFTICQLSYDFGTDARRDYFVQRFSDLPNDRLWKIWMRKNKLDPDSIPLPEHRKVMAAYIDPRPEPELDEQGKPKVDEATGEPIPDRELAKLTKSPEDGERLIFTGVDEQLHLYAFRPIRAFAPQVMMSFAEILRSQANGDFERMSIGGRIIGDLTLYNGDKVPVIDPSLSNLFNWSTERLMEAVSAAMHAAHPDLDDDDFKSKVGNFLERIYYEVRNLGQTPHDRAMNYFATNVFSAGTAFHDALRDGLALDGIRVETSPYSRPYSDCYDVVMTFFDPENRMEKALREYRQTIDVSDVSPVNVGKLRKWDRFA